MHREHVGTADLKIAMPLLNKAERCTLPPNPFFWRVGWGDSGGGGTEKGRRKNNRQGYKLKKERKKNGMI